MAVRLSKDTRGFMNFVNRTDNQLMFNKINVCYESFVCKNDWDVFLHFILWWKNASPI